MVRDLLEKLLMTLAFALLVAFACVGLAYCIYGETEYVKSVEFVTTQAGAPRFQRYRTNEDGLEVVVDAETGVAYIQTTNGATALLDADGTPETVSEVGE